jgi:cell division septal protein FtsQ
MEKQPVLHTIDEVLAAQHAMNRRKRRLRALFWLIIVVSAIWVVFVMRHGGLL